MQRWQEAGFGLYVHWPFCQSKCPYCDFNSHVSEMVNHDDWAEAYLLEMRRYARETPDRVLSSIFFGGGTPSLMKPATVAALVDEAVKLWTPANNIEITLEANPTSVEVGRFTDFRAAGINRVSVGVQALNDQDLRRLGRMHDAREARRAIEISQTIFERTSFDLIYARQDQSLASWEAELTEALLLAAGHLSLYQLTIEPGTVFGARFERGLLQGLPEEDVAADMYDLTQALCEENGRPAYEISNHARAGDESRHNLIYWRCGDFVGIGPGAHGRLTDLTGNRHSTAAQLMPGEWLEGALKGLDMADGRELLTAEAQATEFVLMGMRVNDGIYLQDYQRLMGKPLSPTKIQSLKEQGLVAMTDDRLHTTASGRLLLNWVLKELLLS